MSQRRRIISKFCLLGTPLLLLASLLVGMGPSYVGASSHREAPLIATDPEADNTDTYAFIHPEAPNSVTMVANYIPLEHPEGGPNFHRFSDTVLYEINVDNVGDARAHITYRFEFQRQTRNPATFLYATGPITGFNDVDYNLSTTYNVTEIISPTSGSRITTTIATGLPVAPVNIGSKSTPNYESALAEPTITTLTDGTDTIKVFAGPRDDPFWVDLGSVFDLLSLRPAGELSPRPGLPIGYPGELAVGIDGVSGYNTHAIVIQVPIDRLLRTAPTGETVIGVWATASRRTTRVLNGVGGILSGIGAETHSGPYVQVSRLSMPLVNEAVIPLALKDAFNNLKPEQDFGVYTSGTAVGNLLKQSVLDPELQRLLALLYNVPNPGTNRLDIQAIFLQGLVLTKPFPIETAGGTMTLPAGTNVNRPSKASNVQPAEMIRLNTAKPFRPSTQANPNLDSLCAPTPNYALGLLGGDACGFPNGRRLRDDITEIELAAVAGAAYSVLTNDTFAFNRIYLDVLDDGVDANDRAFRSTFPYLATPHQGQKHIHQQNAFSFLPFVAGNTPLRVGGERE